MSVNAPQNKNDEVLWRQLILATQAGLPLDSEPYARLAEQLGVSEALILDTLNEMQSQGLIRRMAAVPNHYRIGYVFNAMTVWDVHDAALDALAKKLAALEFVSHCYQRPRARPLWPYNLFAMVHATTKEEGERQMAEIRRLLANDCKASDVLLSTRILKKTGVRLAASKAQ